ncbi:MAG: hypothetical protein ACYC23_16100 [Limisphaerales bacterium]
MPVIAPRRWTGLRRAFRWCRFAVWSVLLVGLLFLVYLTAVGVPGFLQTPIREALRARGLALTFDQLRFAWWRGFVAAGVRLESADPAEVRNEIQIQELSIRPDWSRLWRRQFQIRSVELSNARASLDLAATNAPPVPLLLDNLSTQIRFLPDHRWELDNFEARGLGVTVYLTGTITNGPAMRNWSPRRPTLPPPAEPSEAWRRQLSQFITVWRDVSFASAPEVRGSFRGDALDPSSFTAELRVRAAGAQTAWGSLDDFNLVARLNQPRTTNGWFFTGLTLEVANAQTWWGDLANGTIKAQMAIPPGSALPLEVRLNLAADTARTTHARFDSASVVAVSRRDSESAASWQTDFTLAATEIRSAYAGSVSNQIEGTVVHSLQDWTPREARINARFGAVESPWGKARNLEWQGEFMPATPSGSSPDPAWGWWTNLAPYRIRFALEAQGVDSPRLALDSIRCQAAWTAPQLVVSNTAIHVAGQRASLERLDLDVEQRRLQFALESELALQSIETLLPESARSVWKEVEAAAPPRVSLRGSCQLPAWNELPRATVGSLIPGLQLDGSLRTGAIGFRGCRMEAVDLDVGLVDGRLALNKLRLSRPEGDALLQGDFDLVTQEFTADLVSKLDPTVFRSLVTRRGGEAFGLFDFKSPPELAVTAQGFGGDLDRLTAQATVTATNFVFRGEPVDNLTTRAVLADRLLVATNTILESGDQWIRAPGLGLDLRTQWLYLTNAETRMDPMRIARAIHPNVIRAIERYRFDQPPLVRVNGSVPTRGSIDPARMRFDVDGGPFHYWRFNLPQVAGTVHWNGDQVIVTNLLADFYGGEVDLNLGVALREGGDADFQFQAFFRDAEIGPAVRELTLSTNQLQGVATGFLYVRYANSADWNSWEGSGEIAMHSGHLWDFPMFSILSRAMNVVAPGSGNARASAGKGSFTIHRSVIKTEDLKIQASPLFLSCRGTVDFDANVNAEVEAEILRGAPLIGPLLSIALAPVSKVLTYRVTNRLGDPRVEPLYVPGFLKSVFGLSRLPADATPPTEPKPEPPSSSTGPVPAP